MALARLPREILHSILSRQLLRHKDLWACARVSRSLREVSTTVLYSDIDLKVSTPWPPSDKDFWVLECTKEIALLQALASDPALGEKVRNLSISFPNAFQGLRKEYNAFGDDVGQRLARNIPHLTKATLVESGLARHIIANIGSYSQLKELNLRLRPDSRRWGNKSAPVQKLGWTVPCDQVEGDKNSWNTAVHVLEIASAAFPEVVEIAISNGHKNESDAEPHPLPQQIAEKRPFISLPQLQSFRYHGGADGADRKSMLEFLRKNQDSLTTIEVSSGFESLDTNMMEHLREVVKATPKLKSLSIPRSHNYHEWKSHKLPEWSASAFQKKNTTDGVEFFEYWDIGCSLSAEVGRLFSDWTTLRVLKIGAPLLDHGQEVGWPHFDEVAPRILDFVKGLPPSIEELYIDLDDEHAVAEEDEEFDPVAALPPQIFKILPRLRSLDICAFISNSDGGQGWVPEKALFSRRRPSAEEPRNERKKRIWTSRLDCIYQEDYGRVDESMPEVEGNFEGEDAEEPWLGGGYPVVSQDIGHWVDGKYLLGSDAELGMFHVKTTRKRKAINNI